MTPRVRSVLLAGMAGVAMLTSSCAVAGAEGSSSALVVQERALVDAAQASQADLVRSVSVPADAPGPVSEGLVEAVPPPPPPPPPATAAAVRDDDRSSRSEGQRAGSQASAKRPSTQSRSGSKPASGSTAARPAPAPAPKPAPPPAPKVSTDSGFASSLFSAVNGQRTSNGRSALKSSSCARSYALSWAKHLASTGAWQHQSLGPVLRGCGASVAGENIARGGGSVSSTVSAWMGSPAHRANILDRDYTHGGIATVVAPDGRRVSVQIFLRL